MKAKPAKIDINLIPKDPFFQTPIGKALKWALSVGRYIVIFTEMVVIISFVTRFTLDRQITDLNDQIHQKETVILSFGDVEDKIRLVQKKIENYQQLAEQTEVVDIFPKLSELTPRDVKLETLSINASTVSLDGVARSQNSLNVLINNLQLSPEVFNLSVDKIETTTDLSGGLKFRIRFDTSQVRRVNATGGTPPAARPPAAEEEVL